MDNRSETNKLLRNENKFISKLNKLPLICFLKLNFCLSTLHAVPLFECDWMSSIFLTLSKLLNFFFPNERNLRSTHLHKSFYVFIKYDGKIILNFSIEINHNDSDDNIR